MSELEKTFKSDFTRPNKGKNKSAFTLAEVLIVITIIGILTAVVTHTLVAEVGERINSNRELNISQKITKAVELMAAKGDYERFSDTIDFVRALSKYLKMVKICDSEHIRECWPTEKIVTAEGEKYEVKNAKTGNDLYTGYLSNNVAFVMADGAAVLMSFDPAAPIPSKKIFKSVDDGKELPMGGKSEKIPYYYSEAMNAIDFVMDVNGAEGPNSETESSGTYHDIRSFRRAAFSRMSPAVAGQPICSFTADGLCGYVLTDYRPLNCTLEENKEYCSTNYNTEKNYAISYFAGAKKACREMQMDIPAYQVMLSFLSAAGNKVPNGTYMNGTLIYPYNYTVKNADGAHTQWAENADKIQSKVPAICVSYQ